MQEVTAVREERLRIQALLQKVQHLHALLAGHLHALSHTDYQNCTHIYRMLRASKQVSEHDLDPTLATLGQAYSQNRTHPAKAHTGESQQAETTQPAAGQQDSGNEEPIESSEETGKEQRVLVQSAQSGSPTPVAGSPPTSWIPGEHAMAPVLFDGDWQGRNGSLESPG